VSAFIGHIPYAAHTH